MEFVSPAQTKPEFKHVGWIGDAIERSAFNGFVNEGAVLFLTQHDLGWVGWGFANFVHQPQPYLLITMGVGRAQIQKDDIRPVAEFS